jgi:hypothetical protein
MHMLMSQLAGWSWASARLASHQKSRNVQGQLGLGPEIDRPEKSCPMPSRPKDKVDAKCNDKSEIHIRIVCDECTDFSERR